jgi:hypothetical protein
MRRAILLVVVGLIVLFGLIQLVPYGRSHTNPPVVAEPPWNSPQTRALAVRACFDCHSNETVWPWYSNVAPASWLIQRDVDGGRRRLNWSEWGTTGTRFERESGAEAVLRGSMPLWFYLPLHPAARLTAAEKQELANGLQATFGGR